VHAPAHVRALLTDLGQQAQVQAWQADQAQEALRVLYQSVFRGCGPALALQRPSSEHRQGIDARKILSRRG
jgi:hypothetical protein